MKSKHKYVILNPFGKDRPVRDQEGFHKFIQWALDNGLAERVEAPLFDVTKFGSQNMPDLANRKFETIERYFRNK